MASPVWQHAHEIMLFAVAAPDAPFHRRAMLEYRRKLMPKIAAILQIAGDIGQRPAEVGGNKIENSCDRRREAADDEVSIQEQCRDLCGVKNVLQIGVGE